MESLIELGSPSLQSGLSRTSPMSAFKKSGADTIVNGVSSSAAADTGAAEMTKGDTHIGSAMASENTATVSARPLATVPATERNVDPSLSRKCPCSRFVRLGADLSFESIELIGFSAISCTYLDHVRPQSRMHTTKPPHVITFARRLMRNQSQSPLLSVQRFPRSPNRHFHRSG